jgi:hypothetical protein
MVWSFWFPNSAGRQVSSIGSRGGWHALSLRRAWGAPHPRPSKTQGVPPKPRFGKKTVSPCVIRQPTGPLRQQGTGPVGRAPGLWAAHARMVMIQNGVGGTSFKILPVRATCGPRRVLLLQGPFPGQPPGPAHPALFQRLARRAGRLHGNHRRPISLHGPRGGWLAFPNNGGLGGLSCFATCGAVQ